MCWSGKRWQWPLEERLTQQLPVGSLAAVGRLRGQRGGLSGANWVRPTSTDSEASGLSGHIAWGLPDRSAPTRASDITIAPACSCQPLLPKPTPSNSFTQSGQVARMWHSRMRLANVMKLCFFSILWPWQWKGHQEFPQCLGLCLWFPHETGCVLRSNPENSGRMSVSSWSEQEALSRNTYKLAQLDPECTTFLQQCLPMFRVSLAGKGSVETWENERSPFLLSEVGEQWVRDGLPDH